MSEKLHLFCFSPSRVATQQLQDAIPAEQCCLEHVESGDGISYLENHPSRHAESFNAANFLQRLATDRLGRMVLYSESLPSTQTFLQTFLEGYGDGLVCIADQQTAGKGRGTNVWESPFGSLSFSFKVNISKGETLPCFQYLVTLAFVKSIVDIPAFQGKDLKIKWPNDIYGAQLKIGGVLCSSSYNMESRQFEVITGIGINVTNRLPTTCLQKVLDIEDGPKKEDLLAGFFNTLEPMLETFRTEGFTPFLSLYLEHWMHSGQKVEVFEEDNTTTSLVIQGLSPAGYLLAAAEGNSSNSYELHPDGNSFDFFKGLINLKKKILN